MSTQQMAVSTIFGNRWYVGTNFEEQVLAEKILIAGKSSSNGLSVLEGVDED